MARSGQSVGADVTLQVKERLAADVADLAQLDLIENLGPVAQEGDLFEGRGSRAGGQTFVLRISSSHGRVSRLC